MIIKQEYLMVKMVKSSIGCLPNHRCIIYRLGLKKLNRTIFLKVTQENLGMLKKVFYLVEVRKIIL
jgi:ribosomal protein L30